MKKTKMKVSKSELKKLVLQWLEDDTTFVKLGTMSSFQGGLSKFSRANVSEIWVTGEALSADWENLEVAHLGQAETRMTVYSTAERIWDEDGTDIAVMENLSITVLDFSENNHNWDAYGELTNEEKRQVLSKLGAQYMKNSTQGVKSLKGDCKTAWARLKKN